MSIYYIKMIMKYRCEHTIIMKKEWCSMVADNIKVLRNTKGWTQSELAKKLGITRSSVNAWEMGISVPSTVYIVALARLFHVSTDFLLGLKNNASIDVSDLKETEIKILNELAHYFRSNPRDNGNTL